MTLLAVTLLFLASVVAECQDWSLQLFAGAAHNFSTNLEVEQEGFPALDLSAEYSNRPFSDSPYYAYRIGWKSWEVEFIHHKLYLENLPPEIEDFQITHGYNLLLLNHARRYDPDFFVRFGGGAVIAHPEGAFRGRFMNGGYQVAGVVGQIAGEKRFPLGKRFFLSLEGKFTGAYARVDLDSVDVKAPNLAVHVLFGIGYRL